MSLCKGAYLESCQFVCWTTLTAVLILERSGSICPTKREYRLRPARMLIDPFRQVIYAAIDGRKQLAALLWVATCAIV